MAIVTYPLNGITYNAEDAETYLSTRISGIYAADDCFDLSITADRTVTIGPGLAWVRNTRFAGKSICNREALALAIPMADSSKPRTDRIVLRYDKAENKSELAVKTGTPGSAAAAPDVVQTELVYELGLYTVSVAAGSTVIKAADVTDTRLNEQVCGLMRDGVTGVPTQTIYNAAQEFLESLEKELNGVKDRSGLLTTSGGTIAGSLAVTGKLSVGGNAIADYVAESGTRDGWEYIKYTSGLAMMWCNVTVEYSTASVLEKWVSYPFALQAGVVTFGTLESVGSNTGAALGWNVKVVPQGDNKNARVFVHNPSGSFGGADALTVAVLVLGRYAQTSQAGTVGTSTVGDFASETQMNAIEDSNYSTDSKISSVKEVVG